MIRRRPRVAAAACLLLLCLAAAVIGVTIRESTHRFDIDEALRETALHKARTQELDSARRLDLGKAKQEADLFKARDEERDWIVRNQRYAGQIQAAALFKKDGDLIALRDVLLAQEPAQGQKDLRSFEWHYLWRSGHGFMLPPRNTSFITAVAYSKNGAFCASANTDGAIHVFDRHSSELLATVKDHNFEIRSLDFLKEDTQLLSTAFAFIPDLSGFRGEFILRSLGSDKKILRRGTCGHKRLDFGRSMFAVAAAAQTLFIIDRDSPEDRLLMLDLVRGTEQVVLRKENLALAVATPDADRIAVIYRSTLNEWFIELLEPSTGRRIATTKTGRVHMAAFAPDGKTLALGIFPDSLEIRDVPSLNLRKSMEFPGQAHSLEFDWVGDRLAVSDRDMAHILDARSGEPLGSFAHGGQNFSPGGRLAFAPDGQELAFGGVDGRIRTSKNVLIRQDDSLPAPLPQSEAWCLTFSPDGNSLAAGYDHEDGLNQQNLLIWDLKSRKAKSLVGHDATVMAMSLSPDGRILATASYDRSVRLWDLATGNCLWNLTGHTGPVRALAFSPDGHQIASAGSDLSIKIWSIKDGSLQKTWAAHMDLIRSLTFSPDGNFLISAANDQTIKVWDAKSWMLTREIADDAKVQSVACSPDGSLLASGNEKNKVKLWSLATGTRLKSLPGHSGKVRSVVFSPDGKTLASGGEDNAVRLWNVMTGQETLVFPTEHFVNGLAFDAHSKRVAAALHDGKVKIWAAE
jgi:WD40 repeat protein